MSPGFTTKFADDLYTSLRPPPDSPMTRRAQAAETRPSRMSPFLLVGSISKNKEKEGIEVTEGGGETLHQVQKYRKLVLLYEALDGQIDELIMAHGGASENMPADSFARYRELARKRDDVLNEMRALERELHLDDV
jgi:hypothetical protein